MLKQIEFPRLVKLNLWLLHCLAVRSDLRFIPSMSKSVITEAAVNDQEYTVAQLAEEFGITPRAIRFYESKGLLQSRREGRAMFYDRRQRARLKIVLRSKRVGFSLEDTKHYLDLYEADRTNPQRLLDLQEHCQARIQELEAQRKALDSALEELRGIEQSARQDLEHLS